MATQSETGQRCRPVEKRMNVSLFVSSSSVLRSVYPQQLMSNTHHTPAVALPTSHPDIEAESTCDLGQGLNETLESGYPRAFKFLSDMAERRRGFREALLVRGIPLSQDAVGQVCTLSGNARFITGSMEFSESDVVLLYDVCVIVVLNAHDPHRCTAERFPLWDATVTTLPGNWSTADGELIASRPRFELRIRQIDGSFELAPPLLGRDPLHDGDTGVAVAELLEAVSLIASARQ
jgi:hypothetical protein